MKQELKKRPKIGLSTLCATGVLSVLLLLSALCLTTNVYAEKLVFDLDTAGNLTIISGTLDSTGKDKFGRSIKSVYVSQYIKSIGNSAFWNCDNLETVTLVYGVETIGDSAFSSCDSLISIDLPESLTSIGFRAFNGCTNLKMIKIPDSVKTISPNAFENCTSLETVIIGANTKLSTTYVAWDAVEGMCFAGCSSIKQFIVDERNPYYESRDGVLIRKSDNSLIRSNATGIIPNNVSSVSDGAFYGVTSISRITIPSNVSIGNRAFQKCTGLQSIILPDSIKSIGYYAFGGCNKLTEIIIPNGVTSIETGAFSECSALTQLVIPDSVTSIGSNAFSGCSALTRLVIPDSVTSIGSNAFGGCSALTRLVIPDSVTSIGSAVFSGCIGMCEITIPFVGAKKNATESDPKYPIGYMFSASYTYMPASRVGYVAVWQTYASGKYCYYIPASLRSVTITGGIIYNGAFSKCDMISEITVGKNVTQIEKDAFTGCNLDQMTVRSHQIGYANQSLIRSIRCYQGSYEDRIALEAGYSVNAGTLQYMPKVAIGDLDEDGEVTDWDAVLLARYLAGWTVVVTYDAMDIDGDGEITDWDSVLFDRFLAGWNVAAAIS